jgi:hypothetical protein
LSLLESVARHRSGVAAPLPPCPDATLVNRDDPGRTVGSSNCRKGLGGKR